MTCCWPGRNDASPKVASSDSGAGTVAEVIRTRVRECYGIAASVPWDVCVTKSRNKSAIRRNRDVPQKLLFVTRQAPSVEALEAGKVSAAGSLLATRGRTLQRCRRRISG